MSASASDLRRLRKQPKAVACHRVYFGQEVRPHRVLHALHNTRCNELLLLKLVPRLDGEVQNCFHEIKKRGVTAHSSDQPICKPALLAFFILANCHSFFSNNGVNRDVLLNSTYVALLVQLSYRLQTMTSV